MATRKVKNAIDLTTNELIYFKGHAKATYMSDGKTVEDAIIQIGAGGGGIVAETDPIFSASPAASITESKKIEWDNKVDKVSGKQLSTEDFTTALKTKLEGLSNFDDAELSNAIETLRSDFDKLVSGDTTTAIKTFNEVIAFLDGITDTQNLESIVASIEQQIAGKMDKVTLATVATSGSYNDLSNKPTIPSAVTESTVSGWGFTKNTGTITQIKANGTSIATSGVANIPAASTSAYGVTKLSSATNSTSTTLAATASAVKSAYDLANGKQDKLVSGTNIKTVNGTSILGSGDITISGGSGGSSAYSEVSHGTSDTTFTLTPNVFHVWDEVASLTLTLGDETAGVANEFLFQFNSGSTSTTLSLPDTLKWANDSAPTIESNKIYQISILKGLASVLEFDNAPNITLISFTIDNTSFNAESGMLWSEWIASSYNTSGYISITQNKVIHMYTQGNLFTTSGTTVNSSDVIQPIKYTFTNPWA